MMFHPTHIIFALTLSISPCCGGRYIRGGSLKNEVIPIYRDEKKYSKKIVKKTAKKKNKIVPKPDKI
jgi:hypothetical protein